MSGFLTAEQGLALENEQLRKENERLEYYETTTLGLWCIDRDPKDVDVKWIRRNAFQLKALEEK